jgi:hypothetical protein
MLNMLNYVIFPKKTIQRATHWKGRGRLHRHEEVTFLKNVTRKPLK